MNIVVTELPDVLIIEPQVFCASHPILKGF